MTRQEIELRLKELKSEISLLENLLEADRKNPLCIVTVKRMLPTRHEPVVSAVTCTYNNLQKTVAELMEGLSLVTYAFYGYPILMTDSPAWYDLAEGTEPAYLDETPKTVLLAANSHGTGNLRRITVQLK